MIKTKKRGSLIIISGTTCAGKGTVIKKLLENNENYSLSISYTSRYMRDGEVNGVDYYFISNKKFEEKIKNGDFLEYAKVHNSYYYGTPKAELEKLLNDGKDVILEIEVQGAKQVKELFPETVLIFILPPSMKEILRRIKSRGKESKEQIIERFRTAYKEINEVNKYNYVVVNDNLEDAVKKVDSIILSEKCRVDRIEELYMENEEEMIHEILMEKEFNNEIKTII